MKTIKLGTAGPDVFPMALGCMGMGSGSWYGPSDETESIATIHAALERGVNLIDTGDFYGMGKNELLVGKALHGRRDVRSGHQSERDEDVSRVQPVATRRRLHRRLQAGATRSESSDRRYGRRDRRHGEG